MGLQLEVMSGVGALGTDGTTTVLDMSREPTDDELIEIVHAGSRVPISTVREQPGGALYPDPPVFVAEKDPGWEGRLEVGHPEMMADLGAVVDRHDDADEEFPFRLICRRNPHVFNTPALGRVPKQSRYNPLSCHPDDVARIGLAADSYVTVRSARARITAIVEEDPTLRPGVVSMAHNWGVAGSADSYDKVGANSGRLIATDRDFDRYSGQPLMSNVPVAVVAGALEEDPASACV
jgi:anaerobic selenocysteine-containing dehydrogenase